MGYFKSPRAHCEHYDSDWQDTVRHIKTWDPNISPLDISSPLEAKALQVFTIVKYQVRAARFLFERVGQKWEPIFIEATSLLFPMIELVGHARLDDGQVNRFYRGSDVSTANLWAGLRWLSDPEELPQVQNNRLKHDSTKVDDWEIRHLIALRHYYLHGSRYSDVSIADCMSCRQPEVFIRRAEKGIRVYWKKLKQDDGNKEWVERLARADIRPLAIKGSGIFEHGLIDPRIVDFLELGQY